MSDKLTLNQTVLDELSAFGNVEVEVASAANDGNSADVFVAGNAFYLDEVYAVGNDGNDALDFKDDLGASGSPRDNEWNLDEVDADSTLLSLKFIKGNYCPTEEGKLLLQIYINFQLKG